MQNKVIQGNKPQTIQQYGKAQQRRSAFLCISLYQCTRRECSLRVAASSSQPSAPMSTMAAINSESASRSRVSRVKMTQPFVYTQHFAGHEHNPHHADG